MAVLAQILVVPVRKRVQVAATARAAGDSGAELLERLLDRCGRPLCA
jgi:hypothetical protein